ncbi:MAG TPA: inositol monophosphatase family protein [Rhabdaerophilum sp.]|nr:inositol monophosphatase family protein [Rhabdaerophilum sp.]
MLRSPIMNVMTAAAIKAGKSLKRDFAELPSLTISRKGPGDFVSEADKKAERILFQELSKARPGYGFLMEEEGTFEGTDKSHRFIIDPLDGTTNFLHNIAQFAISIGLEREDEIVAGLVYNPATEEMYVAEKGHGAFAVGPDPRDNYRLRVSPRTDFADAVIGCGIPHAGRGDHGQFIRELAGIMPRCSGVRRMGAAALDLAYVASGRLEGFWERNLSPWDLAAGILLIREAGGFVTAADGSDRIFETRGIIAGNEVAHAALLKAISAA